MRLAKWQGETKDLGSLGFESIIDLLFAEFALDNLISW